MLFNDYKSPVMKGLISFSESPSFIRLPSDTLIILIDRDVNSLRVLSDTRTILISKVYPWSGRYSRILSCNEGVNIVFMESQLFSRVLSNIHISAISKVSLIRTILVKDYKSPKMKGLTH